MNLKTILLNAALGILSGFISIFCLSSTGLCCCGVPLSVCLPVFFGTMLSTLLTHGRTVALSNTLWGMGHGLFAAALATGTLMVGVNSFTSDEAVTRAVASYRSQIEEARDTYRKVADEEPDKISEEELEQADELLAESSRLLEEMESDPAMTRELVAKTFGSLALLCGFLLGALGGLAGHLTFGRKRTPRGEEPPADHTGSPGSPGSDPDRMQIPEQPKQWWEK